MQTEATTPEPADGGSSTTMADDREDPFPPVYGSHPCAKPDCSNWAYWKVGDDNFCGIHSKNKARVELVKNADIRDQVFKLRHRAHLVSVLTAARANVTADRPGSISMGKLRMMKQPKLVPGVLNIAPNKKASGSIDAAAMLAALAVPGDLIDIAEGLASSVAPTLAVNDLSPMKLGPVRYEPTDPTKTEPTGSTATIECDHQCRKVHEVELQKCSRLEIVNYIQVLLNSGTPHRHKPLPASCLAADPEADAGTGTGTGSSKHRKPARLPNAPAFSLRPVPATSPRAELWPDGKYYARVSYAESRPYYCNEMERLGGVHPAFGQVLDLIRAGVNVCIVGYDAWDTSMLDFNPATAYADISRPFGHEAVLATMWMKESGQLGDCAYPWRLAIDPDLWFPELMPELIPRE